MLVGVEFVSMIVVDKEKTREKETQKTRDRGKVKQDRMVEKRQRERNKGRKRSYALKYHCYINIKFLKFLKIY
jgi:hypothetical protein